MSGLDLRELRKFLVPEFVFGRNAWALAGTYALNYGGTRILVVSDEGVAAAGWTGKVVEALEREGLHCTVFTDLTPNPKSEEVMKGAELYASAACNLIVAVGGGSPMDCAKGIGIVSTNRRNILDFAGVDRITEPGPPLICIPTTAGSAADISQFAIVTDERRRVKVSIVSKALVPDVSLVDPATTLTLDAECTAGTGFDALSHAFEAFVSNAHSPVTDLFALEAVRRVGTGLPCVLKNLHDYECRTNMMLASLYAGTAFSNASLGLAHAMAHGVGGYIDSPHGESNLILLPYVVKYNYRAAPDRYRQLAEALGVETGGLDDDRARDALVGWIVGMQEVAGGARRLRDLGVRREDLRMLAGHAAQDACLVTNPCAATTREIEEIYEQAF